MNENTLVTLMPKQQQLKKKSCEEDSKAFHILTEDFWCQRRCCEAEAPQESIQESARIITDKYTAAFASFLQEQIQVFFPE